MGMKGILCGIVILAAGAAAVTPSVAFARSDLGGGVCVDGGGTHEIPTPATAMNQKVELADGEFYMLFGKVVINDDQTYFEVDLNSHPWLASAVRKANPLYPLEGKVSQWRRYENVRVRLSCIAHGRITGLDTRNPQYVLSLGPVTDSGSRRRVELAE